MSRLQSILVGCVVLLWIVPASARGQAPTEGVVIARSKVRSGPSEKHYPTGILERDDRVVVVGEPEPGWLAIEPPHLPNADSFSWISGAFVKELGNSEGEVTGDNVQVRIGTPLDERQREYPQIKLRRGDRVRIRERKTSGEGTLANVWYKVDPPKGEVRYISAQFVQLAGGRRPATKNAPSDVTSKPREPATQERDYPEAKQHETQSADDPDEDEPQPDPKDNSPRSLMDRANNAYKALMQRSLPDRDIAKVRALYEQAAKWTKSGADHAIVVRRLDELEEQENRIKKFEEFDRLVRSSKQRDEALLSMNRKKEEPAEPLARGYDGSGILRRSTVTIDGKPAFVLVSPQGGIRYYITPSPGLDLMKYLDQTVAVRGPVAYRPEVRYQHITVRDVSPIEVRR